MCFGSFWEKGATEARTWLYFFDGVFRLRRILVDRITVLQDHSFTGLPVILLFCYSVKLFFFPELVGVGHSIAFDYPMKMREKVKPNTTR